MVSRNPTLITGSTALKVEIWSEKPVHIQHCICSKKPASRPQQVTYQAQRLITAVGHANSGVNKLVVRNVYPAYGSVKPVDPIILSQVCLRHPLNLQSRLGKPSVWAWRHVWSATVIVATQQELEPAAGAIVLPDMRSRACRHFKTQSCRKSEVCFQLRVASWL